MHAEASYASDGGQSAGDASAPSRESSFNTPKGRIFSSKAPQAAETGYRHKHAAKFLTEVKKPSAKPVLAVAAPVRAPLTAIKQRPATGAGNIKAS